MVAPNHSAIVDSASSWNRCTSVNRGIDMVLVVVVVLIVVIVIVVVTVIGRVCAVVIDAIAAVVVISIIIIITAAVFTFRSTQYSLLDSPSPLQMLALAAASWYSFEQPAPSITTNSLVSEDIHDIPLML